MTQTRILRHRNARLAEYSPVVPARGRYAASQLPPGKKLVALTFDLCEQPFRKPPAIKAVSSTSCAATGSRPRSSWAASGCFHNREAHAAAHVRTPCLKSPTTPGSTETFGSCRAKRWFDEIKNAQLAYEQVRRGVAGQAVHRTAGQRARATNRRPRRLGLMRFPYGACSPAALNEGSAQQGLVPNPNGTCRPAIRPLGCRSRESRGRFSPMLRPGSIVLFHAKRGAAGTRRERSQASSPGWKARGYEFATVFRKLLAGRPSR